MRGLTVAVLMACVCSLAPACSREADTAPGVATVAVKVVPARVEAGAPVQLLYSFTVASAASALPADQWVFVHALDDTNELLWTDDHAPPTPTQDWKPGAPVTYTRTMFVPRSTRQGDIRFEVGLFSRRSGERLPLVGVDRGMRSYEVATISVQPLSNPVVAGDGWYDVETGEGPGREWHWSRKDNLLSFRNPKAPATLYLQVDQPVTALPASQAVEVRGSSGVLSTFTLSPGTTELVRIPISAEQLGTGETVDLTLAVGSTFVPAATAQLKSSDSRELGIRLLHAFVGPGEAGPR
jgi:hypothetical protein